MSGIKKIGYTVLCLGVILLGMGVSNVYAETITSPSYKIDGNFGGSFGGQINSTSYKMTSIGGEAIVGAGSSGSYIIDQRQTRSVAPVMQLDVQPAGLVGYYPLNENTGTVTADASQYQNDGTLNSTAAWQASGQMGSSGVAINGPIDSSGDGAVLVPDNPNLPTGSAMTFHAWVLADDWYPNQAIASHWAYEPVTGGSGSWAFQIGPSGNLRVLISGGAGDTGNNYVDTDVDSNGPTFWRQVAMVFDGTQPQADRVKIYLEGVRMNTTVHGVIPSTLQNSTGDFSIGSFPGLGRAFTGTIDHVKLFNRAFSQEEIKAESSATGGAGVASGIRTGVSSISGSKEILFDAIVRTTATSYNLAIEEDRRLTDSFARTLPPVSNAIATPSTWNEGTTKGYGFTLTGAPILDVKWGNGTKYARFPASATTFYSGTGNEQGVLDVINLRLRVDVTASQAAGDYSNKLTYTGTMIP